MSGKNLSTIGIFLIGVILCTYSLHATDEDFILFSGSSNPLLTEAIAKELLISTGSIKVGKFNDGEIDIQVLDNVRNRDVFVVQSVCPNLEKSINDNMMELYLLVRTLKRSSAKTITAVVPYYGYARQDRKVTPRVPISASDVAMLMETAGVDRVVAIDLHCGQIQGFFHHTPVDNLFASTIFVPYFANKKLRNPVIVSPDAGGVERTKQFMNKLAQYGEKSQMAMIIKQRAGAGVIEKMNLVGSVRGADAIIVDDMCDTGGTLVKAAQLLKENGAKRVFAAITHPVFSDPALERISNSVINELVITDTIPLRESRPPSNIKQISVAPLIAEAIKRINNGKSVSILFE